jgi:alanine racemase
MNYTISEIAEAAGLELVGEDNGNVIEKLFTDSRSVVDFHNSAYIALKGPRHNGHDFISDLLEKGCRNFIIEKNGFEIHKSTNACFLVCSNTTEALQRLAQYHRNGFNKTVIGITGSNGKTIIKEWLQQIFSLSKKTCASPKSYNSQIGVPLSVLQLNNDNDIGIFEAGISAPGEMEKLERMIQPQVGVVCNLGAAHDEGFISRKQKAEEKIKLFVHAEKIIYCADHADIADGIISMGLESKKSEWSFTNKNANYFVDVVVEKDFSSVIISGKSKLEYKINFIDKASIENSIHVACVLLECKIDGEQIILGMSTLRPLTMRLEMKRGINSCIILNDAYSLDLTSLSLALDYLEKSPGQMKKTLILSDLPNSNGNETKYKSLGKLIEEKKVEKVISIGTEINKYRDFLPAQTKYFSGTEAFLEQFHPSQFENEKILIKGARTFEFEKIENLLQEKRHQTILEINLDKLIHNVNYFRSRLKKGTKIMAMVKASSYGSGDIEVARELEHHRVNYLAVAYTDEGVALRKKGIRLPIMVMNPEPEGFDSLIANQLEPEIYSLSLLKAFNSSALKNSLTEYPIHLKLDTGMKRLGFSNADFEKLIVHLKESKQVKIKSVFSHLTGSDDSLQDAFTLKQIEIFKKQCLQISEALGYEFIRHICNSAGISRFPEAHFEMVRLGIGMYGMGCMKEDVENLQMPLRFVSRVSQIHNLRVGETVGYNQKGKANADTRTATIPVGYADGIRRSLGNGNFSFTINQKAVKTIGNICMDMSMVNLNETEIKEGDEVVIFDKVETLQKMAAAAGTIAYEILTGISARVKRVYVYG